METEIQPDSSNYNPEEESQQRDDLTSENGRIVTEESSAKVEKKKTSLPKPFHLHHDLNQLCFEKRERKIVDRFGFGTRSLQQVKEQKAKKEKKDKTEKKIEKAEKADRGDPKFHSRAKIKKANPEPVLLAEKLLVSPPKIHCESQSIVPTVEPLTEEKYPKFSENPKKAVSPLKSEISPENKIIPPSSTQLPPPDQAFENYHGISLIDPIEKKSSLIQTLEAPPINPHKHPAPRNPLGLLRKRGRKRRGRWGAKPDHDSNDQKPAALFSSLNKIFKKGGNSSGRKPLISKKYEVPAEIFQNAYLELVYNGDGNTRSLSSNVEIEPILQKGLVESGVGETSKQEEEKKEEFTTLALPQDVSKEKGNLIGLVNEIHNINTAFQPVKSYINCDLRYFNFNFLVEKIGYFDSFLLQFF